MKLHTTGTKIQNERGEEVLLRGVNCAGLEWDAGNGSVLRAACLAADEWGANIIRLPVSQDRWFGWCPEQKEPDGAERYRALVDRIIRELAERGCCLTRSGLFLFRRAGAVCRVRICGTLHQHRRRILPGAMTR